jgi:hypothetical protein
LRKSTVDGGPDEIRREEGHEIVTWT